MCSQSDDPSQHGPRFEVRALINGEGWVIVDTAWENPMIGPYPKNMRAMAYQRAAEFEADPSKVPSERNAPVRMSSVPPEAEPIE